MQMVRRWEGEGKAKQCLTNPLVPPSLISLKPASPRALEAFRRAGE